MPSEEIEIRGYALTQYPAMADDITGIINLHDVAGKHVANLLFVRQGSLPASRQDGAGLILIHLWESAFPTVVAMLRSGAQIFLRWDGSTGSIGTSLQTTG